MQAQDIAESPSQLERVGRWVQDALNRLIMGASAGDGVDGVAALEIENGDELEGNVRHGARSRALSSWFMNG